ncbi:hydroxylysine kinase [Rhinophrynus dorsalis]
MTSENEQGSAVIASKPALNESQVAKLMKSLFDLNIVVASPLASYDDQNFYVQTESDIGINPEYVMKITNGEDSKSEELIEAQTYAMMFLSSEGIPAQKPIYTKTGKIMSLEAIDYGSTTQKHMVRLLTYLPGTPVARIEATPDILFDIGKLAATIDELLTKKFQYPNKLIFDRGQFIWNLSNTPLLRKYIYAIKEKKLQEVLERVIKQYETFIQPNINIFRKCINHGDLNDNNILLQEINSPGRNDQCRYNISGILDFSDMSYGYYIFELAITIMYMMVESKDPLHVGGYILAGFESVFPLMPEEREALFILVNCRFAQSLVMARYSVMLCPENEEYLMITAKTGWKHLLTLQDMGKEAVEKIWFDTAKSYNDTLH